MFYFFEILQLSLFFWYLTVINRENLDLNCNAALQCTPNTKLLCRGIDFCLITKEHFACLLSRPWFQALTEPAAFSKPTGCDSEVPYEKLTLAQARKGTPGTVSVTGLA